MLERYFVKPVTVDRIRASWIGGPIERYVGWLSEQGYASRNVFRRVPILVQFGIFAAARGARLLDELPGHVDAFVAEWLQTHAGRSSPAARRKIASTARGPIEQMLRVALPDLPAANHRPHLSDPFIGEAPGFFTYLREERGLREATITPAATHNPKNRIATRGHTPGVPAKRQTELRAAAVAADRNQVAGYRRRAGHSGVTGHKLKADRRPEVMGLHPRLRRDQKKLQWRAAMPWWQSQ